MGLHRHLSGAFAILVIMALWLLAPAIARGEIVGRCEPVREMIEGLDRIYGEKPLFVGTGDDNRSIVILATPDGTSWTAIIDRADGIYCVVADGFAWDAPDPLPPGTLN